MEKKIQREREMENGEFDDKEAFVTSAYKKKLEERAEEEEREKRAAALEGRGGGNACRVLPEPCALSPGSALLLWLQCVRLYRERSCQTRDAAEPLTTCCSSGAFHYFLFYYFKL